MVRFKKPECDLVWNRDYSLVKGKFSVSHLKAASGFRFKQKVWNTFLMDHGHLEQQNLCINDFDIRHVVGLHTGDKINDKYGIWVSFTDGSANYQ